MKTFDQIADEVMAFVVTLKLYYSDAEINERYGWRTLFDELALYTQGYSKYNILPVELQVEAKELKQTLTDATIGASYPGPRFWRVSDIRLPLDAPSSFLMENDIHQWAHLLYEYGKNRT